MNKKLILIIPVVLGVIILYLLSGFEKSEFDYKYRDESFIFNAFGNEGENLNVSDDGKLYWTSFKIELKPEFKELYNEIGVIAEPQRTIVIYPIFTASAYTSPGFYDYYKKTCDESCLTTKIQTSLIGQASGNALQVFTLLGYDVISDVDVDIDPDILKKYDKVILLHSEYVTQKEFDAITSHPNVIYLYPNALHAKIEHDELTNTITLIRGHGYPDESIANGFDWEFENTNPYEYDRECKNWEFYENDNGIMLNCYPEIQIMKDAELLKKIKEWS